MEKYREWDISLEPDNWYHATSPNYDASYEGEEDGWIDNGEKCSGKTLPELYAEIDDFIAEQGAANENDEKQIKAQW